MFLMYKCNMGLNISFICERTKYTFVRVANITAFDFIMLKVMLSNERKTQLLCVLGVSVCECGAFLLWRTSQIT